MNEAHVQLLAFLPEDTRTRMTRVFRFMAIAEEEIADAMKRWPRRATRIRRAFGLVYPGDLIAFGEDTYRAHVRELLGRVMRGEDVAPGTYAECLAALSRGSLNAPLEQTHAAAMDRCFFEVFGRYVDDELAREAWPGAADEVIATLRRRIGQRLKRAITNP